MNNPNISHEVSEQPIDLEALVKILIRHLKLIVIVTMLAVIAGGSYCYFLLKPMYNAKTLLLVTQVTGTLGNSQAAALKDDVNAIISSAYRTPVLTMNTYIGALKSETLMQRIIDKLNLTEMGYTPRSLASHINPTVVKDSGLIEVAVDCNNPGLAVSIANTLSEEFKVMITEKNLESMDQSIKNLQGQIEVIRKEMAGAADPSEKQRLTGVLTLLSEGVTKTQIARSLVLDNSNLVVISPATMPYQVMDKKLNIIGVAVVLGLVGSIGLALLLELTANTKAKHRKVKSSN